VVSSFVEIETGKGADAWLDISYPAGDLPQEWTADLESEVPKMFQLRD
jgi:hypothetical protein